MATIGEKIEEALNLVAPKMTPFQEQVNEVFMKSTLLGNKQVLNLKGILKELSLLEKLSLLVLTLFSVLGIYFTKRVSIEPINIEEAVDSGVEASPYKGP